MPRPDARGSPRANSLALLDLAAPPTTLGAARFDQLLEALEVTPHTTAVGTERAAQRLDQALGLVLHDDGDACPALVDWLEHDRARVEVAVKRLPSDALVRLLLPDLGVPLVALATDFGDPVDVRVVGLLDRFDALHELRELLELGPLVVRGGDWDVDLNRFFDACH
jgi:hypothetical protein